MDGGSGAAGLAALSVCEFDAALADRERDHRRRRGAGDPRGRGRRPPRRPRRWPTALPATTRGRPRSSSGSSRAATRCGTPRATRRGRPSPPREGANRERRSCPVDAQKPGRGHGLRREPFLAGYAESQDVPVHEAGHRFDGLKQFLFVCAAAPGTHTPSDAVAALWRSFLLASREYRQFCHGYLGRFVDHRTLEAPSGEGYLATRRAAEARARAARRGALADRCADGAGRDDSGNRTD